MHWFFLLLFFSGCARFPQEMTYSLQMEPPCLESTVADALLKTPFVSGDFPEECWWQLFEDRQLSALVEKALEEQPSLKKAEARVRASEEEAAIQRASLFPFLSLDGQAAEQYFSKNSFFRAFAPMIPGRINEYTLEFNFFYEFDFWGKNRHLFRAALGEARAEAAEAAQAKILLSTAVVLAYFQWQIENKRYTLLQRQLELKKTYLQLTTFRNREALDDKQQSLEAKTEQLQLVQQLVRSRQNIKLLENTLKMLLGLGPDAPLALEERLLPQDAYMALPSALSTNLLARRPDLTALIWRAEAAAERIGAARADFYPNVNLVGLIGLDSVFLRKLFLKGSQTAAVTPAFHLPIFTGGRIRARFRERKAEFDEAIQAYNEKLLEAVREVADQISSLQMSQHQLIVQQQIVYEKAEISKLVSNKNKEGISSTLEVIRAQEALFQEQDSVLLHTLQKLIAIINLIKALGGGFQCL